ncbi:septum formation family protein [Streptomyces sp. NPDC001795]|uniref:septum formation family protein n=1 Tax=Streptomyces sp. NPDC001795 TaxID=3154525 RepID=UPI003317F116
MLLLAVAGITTGAALFASHHGHEPATDAGTTTGGAGAIGGVNPSDTDPSDASPSEDDTPSQPVPEKTFLTQLSRGDCVNSTTQTSYYVVVPCSAPHNLQTLGVFGLDEYMYPGDATLGLQANSVCLRAFRTAAVNWSDGAGGTLGYLPRWPSSQAWAAGSRSVVCFLRSTDGSDLEEDRLG